MYDVLVIGAGIIGTTVSRELSRYELSVLCVEKMGDFSCGVTKANSGIVHAGHDAVPGSKKAIHNVRGNALYEKWSRELDFPFKKNGSLVLYHDESEYPLVEELYMRGEKNGVTDMELIGEERLYELEPNLKHSAKGALWLKTGGITCPFEFAIAAAENAEHNGVGIKCLTEVEGIERKNGYYSVSTSSGVFEARAVVNAAGLWSDDVNNMVCTEKLNIIPRRGQYIMMDNTMGATFTRTLFNVPGKMGKGILISPTTDGNLFLGPTAEDVPGKNDTETTAEGLFDIAEKTLVNWDFPRDHYITQFSGIRPHLESGDFVIGQCADGFFNACGIESPGLTAAPSIAETLSSEVASYLGASKKTDFDPIRKAIPRFKKMTDEERREAIARDPRYSHVLCRCEQVTEAEIVDAVRRGARTMDAVKRRTRAGMGKCQRGFCGPETLTIIARELGISRDEVLTNEPGTEVLTGRIGK